MSEPPNAPAGAVAKLLIANRGEIAVRIARAAADLGIPSVAVHSADDVSSPHIAAADEACPLEASGPRAYLDIDQIVAAAVETGCDALHPGYGFLAEHAGLAAACDAAGVTFVGPPASCLRLFGDKTAARTLAIEQGVPVVPASPGLVEVDGAIAFLDGLGPNGAMMIKAAAGGGGRGMRVVRVGDDVADAFQRCRSEATAGFGNGDLFVEQLVADATHIEVQVVADARGDVSHLWERECSLQRRHQKIVELAPSPWLDADRRTAIVAAAMSLAVAAGYRNVGTFEFLVSDGLPAGFAFIEANPRLQVEHTVTEEVTGVDIVQAQLRIAAGATLTELGLGGDPPPPRGVAIQARVNMERMDAGGAVRPSGGTLSRFELPAGPGIRVDTYGVGGYTTNPSFDSLLAKVIAHAPGGIEAARRRLARALGELQIGGVETNAAFLAAVLDHPDVADGAVSTTWLDDHVAELVAAACEATSTGPTVASAGAPIDPRDPLAALSFFRDGAPMGTGRADAVVGPPGTEAVAAPLQGTVVSIAVAEGDVVRPGQRLLVMEAMKMEHLVDAAFGGVVRMIVPELGSVVFEDHPLVFIERRDGLDALVAAEQEWDPDYIRPDLQALFDRRAFGQDAHRPEAVARRHSRGRLTVREHIELLMDPGSWIEYGELATAGQRRRRPQEELIRKTPADGLVCGIGSVNGELFDERRARTAFISYDDTVFAGTQGMRGHHKTDRMVDLANELSLPLIFHAEGAGGRSGETDYGEGHGFGGDVRTWDKMCALSGKVPMIGITAGWCYAGNAAILGVTDVIIATRDALIAMGGPATIEGGGMGAFLPEEVGPISDIAPAGTVDLVVDDHASAVRVSKQLLSYFQGSIPTWECADQRRLRAVIPENRLRSFDVRTVIDLLADTGSVLELRPDFGIGAITAFARIEGHPVGITANNNARLGGAIDSAASDKIARFWQLCDAFNIPIVSLVDTPGMMVGPEVERSGLVRHCSRLFVTGANLRTPRFSVILRKGYALGSLAMMTGSTRASLFTVVWPTGEHGGMNIESSVTLGHRDRLAAIDDIDERAAEYERLLAAAYERGSALNVASTFELDNVIDPAETRYWITRGLLSVPDAEPLRRGRAQFLDTW